MNNRIEVPKAACFVEVELNANVDGGPSAVESLCWTTVSAALSGPQSSSTLLKFQLREETRNSQKVAKERRRHVMTRILVSTLNAFFVTCAIQS